MQNDRLALFTGPGFGLFVANSGAHGRGAQFDRLAFPSESFDDKAFASLLESKMFRPFPEKPSSLPSGSCVLSTAVLVLSVLASVSNLVCADESLFETKVKPLLEDRCLGCHSDNIRKGDFSLTTIADINDNGFLDTESPETSHLIQLVTTIGDDPAQMPKEGKPLTSEEVQILQRWISEGAVWPKDLTLVEQSKADSTWWSLQPLKPVNVPQWPQDVAAPDTPSNEIDHFIANGLSAKKLQMNPRADRAVLVRRAYFDLTGLPPSPADIDRFVNDEHADAWSKLIDELLASEHYGERWGRHWLDVVRFGESNGFERNVIINELWPFRDYVIESINEDKPFNEFIREHIAGDLLGPGDPAVEVGSAFLVAGPYDNVGNQDAVQAAQIRANTIDEMIRATSEAFLGLTVGCARCHDHKFDPILQADYYSMYSTFAGVRHGVKVVATADEAQKRNQRLMPLQQRRAELDRQRNELTAAIQQRADERAAEFEAQWVRAPTSRTGTEDRFPPVLAKWIRLVSKGQDSNPEDHRNFRIDEFEVWSADNPKQNVALSSHGSIATGSSRQIADFPGAYGPELAIDGKTGERYLANGGGLTIEFAKPERIDRIFFSSARNEPNPQHGLFLFLAEYEIEVSLDGKKWQTVASSSDRKPVNARHRSVRLKQLVTTPDDQRSLRKLNSEIGALDREIAAIPPLPRIWVGTRNAHEAKGPFHIFVGGSPQRLGKKVLPASLAVLNQRSGFMKTSYQLQSPATEGDKRLALAKWISDDSNPLTARVLANRIWHYHFGTGIVATPSDFGYMGSEPSHPELLDWLTNQLIANNWRIKDLHRTIMLSAAYQQSSDHRDDGAAVDSEARLLWKFPMRRLSAEEIRDSMLSVAGVLKTDAGGPGFRLYDYLQDNVATYVPRDQHGPETYRRAVYHQNARAAIVDLMTEFDQPDCAFGAPRRSSTTTPLQALTSLNHSFTLDMSNALAQRLEKEHAGDVARQVQEAWRLCCGREPTKAEADACREHVGQQGLRSFCRVMLNTSEMIYVK